MGKAAQAPALQASQAMAFDLVAVPMRWLPGRLAAVLLATAALTLVLPFSGCRRGATSSAPRAAPSVPVAPASGAPSPTTRDETSAEAAAAVLRDYYDAIAAGRYEQAYRLWWNAGRASGQTLDQFRGGFGDTARVEATIEPPGRIEGAAGSRYVDVPVTVHARTRRGESQCFTGSYTLRRSEVDGAGEEQRRWRIYSASTRNCSATPSPTASAAP